MRSRSWRLSSQPVAALIHASDVVLDALFGLGRVQPPQVAGVQQQVDGPRGSAGDEEAVAACGAQHGAEVAAAVAVAPAACERGLADDHEAPVEGHAGGGEQVAGLRSGESG